MSGSTETVGFIRPAAPKPLRKPPSLIPALRMLRENVITAFAEPAYETTFVEIGRGRKRVSLVNDPAAIEQVLVTHAERYAKSDQQQRRLKPALGDGLLTAEGAAWRSARRVTAPLFSPRAIAQLGGDMSAAADAMAERWFDRSVDPPLDLSAEFQRLTYEIVSRTVFSGALDADRVRLHAHMAVYFDTIGRLDMASVLGLPAWWPNLAAFRAKPSLRFFRSVVGRVVGERAEAPAEREAVDLLDRLMRAPDPASGQVMTTEAVADNVLTFLAAGHETTGNALAWTLYLLALFPDAEERMREELAGLSGETLGRETIERLSFSRAVLNETLRLYPPAPFIGRAALEPDTVCGSPIRPGDEIVISPWIVHRHRALWDAPDSFRPERFLPGAPEPQRGAFLPFGLGPRICIGQGFALQEMLIVLARILPAFRFELAAPEKVFPQARITLQPSGGMWMKVSRRA